MIRWCVTDVRRRRSPKRAECALSAYRPVFVFTAHNLTWPAGVTDDVYDEAALLANFSLSHMFYTKEQRKLGGGVLVGQVCRWRW